METRQSGSLPDHKDAQSSAIGPVEFALFERINAALPQTQCTRCAYPDCAAYARAIAGGEAAINQCPPGGAEGVQRLSSITGLPVLALNSDNGSEGPRSIAMIDEAWCIGCTLCLPVCPTDAIFGSNKMMHTVIEHYCTGCELCIPVCPVDCISLENVTGERSGWAAWSEQDADLAQERYKSHVNRRLGSAGDDQSGLEEKVLVKLADLAPHSLHSDLVVVDQKRSVIEAALTRARARRHPG